MRKIRHADLLLYMSYSFVRIIISNAKSFKHLENKAVNKGRRHTRTPSYFVPAEKMSALPASGLPVENYNLHLPPLAELAKVGKMIFYFTLISIILVQLTGFLTFFLMVIGA
jgi:hypothetical protein